MNWRQKVGTAVQTSEKDLRGAGECTEERSDGEQSYDEAFADSRKLASRHVSWNPALSEAKKKVVH